MIIEITFTNKLGNSNKYGFGNIGDAIEFLNSINKDSHDVAGGLTTDAPACGDGQDDTPDCVGWTPTNNASRTIPTQPATPRTGNPASISPLGEHR